MAEMMLGFYGITAKITGPSAVIQQLGTDFSYFKISGQATSYNFEVSLDNEHPAYNRIPRLKASVYQPDSISYDDGCIRYVDYQGMALSVYDFCSEKGELFSKDEGLLRELAYLLILSRAGEMLDKKGIHRVHACGFSYKGKGVICLMPQGGGKTTLCLELLKNPDIKLLSDDSPLLTKTLKLLPFPLRIGVGANASLKVPQEYLGVMERRKYGKKILIDTRYFAGSISAQVSTDYIFVGERESSDNSRIVKEPGFGAFKALLRDCVAGLGLPQMVEYFLRSDARDMVSKTGIVFSRIITCLKAVFRAETFRFTIGTDTAGNAETLLKFLEKNA